MTLQRTFTRGNYIGNWSEETGSLRILFKGKEEAILHDKTEDAAEKMFLIYVEPDWHSLADVVFDNYMKSGIPFSQSFKTIGEDERHIEHDVYMVKKVLKDIFAREGFDEGDIERELRETN